MKLEVQALKPFGVGVRTAPGADLSAIEPREIEALLAVEKLVLIRGAKAPSKDALVDFCRRFSGEGLLQWDFGAVMEMRETPDAKNYLFSRERVPFHWDGAFHRVPSFLVFHCLQAPVRNAGGETLFCDTEKAWSNLASEKRAAWKEARLTYSTEKVAHYGGRITEALVQRHPKTGREILRFAEPVESKLNPVRVEVEGADGEALMRELGARVYDPAVLFRHQWEEGDLLIADNHALIHGREAFERDCPRHLRRVQIL